MNIRTLLGFKLLKAARVFFFLIDGYVRIIDNFNFFFSLTFFMLPVSGRICKSNLLLFHLISSSSIGRFMCFVYMAFTVPLPMDIADILTLQS